MADGLTFYTNPMSRGRIARWMLEEAGAEYETVVLDYASSMKAGDYRAINPMGKVPAIVHNGHVVTECPAICAYLADAFPDAGLAPPVDQRAAYYRWLFFAAGPVEQAVTMKSLGVEPPAERSGMIGFGSFDKMVDVLESAVSATPYVAGEQFSAADVYLGSQIAWGTQFGTLPKRDGFTSYLDRILARPAYARANAKDDALIAAAAAPVEA
ncbi:MAG: glutathione S-transferase family protein [Sphingomonas sp.]|uniref:glutathione S-transferase family protein n=1 Tax=Sphingomonas sp. TaxID=28214 RepID=UPI0025CDFC04|nr:glutathione S-transferase family protein [Sphingomonas sp.]MBY0285297.1 glutathione S-transferase family protein [Sphingomonas sp.]